MIKNTFIHIPSVSKNFEINLWKKNILTWQDFLEKNSEINLSSEKRNLISLAVNESINNFEKENFDHFSKLPQNQHWRMYDSLKKVCFLDIETTGLSKYRNDITLIGMHSNNGTKIFMNGKNLEKFSDEIKKYDMIVTFNGKCFDVPFIKAKFPDANIPLYHSDLRFLMSELGFRGGLKNIELQKGIVRDEDLKDVDGFEAVRLWNRYQRGDNHSLEILKKYLSADVENLKILMDSATTELKNKHFYSHINNG